MRTFYTDEFIERFKGLYAKFGRDVDCVETLRSEYIASYPDLMVSHLTRLRLKRKEQFEEARQLHSREITKLQGDNERLLLTKARDANSRVVAGLLRWQDELLFDFETLTPEVEAYQQTGNLLLSNITAIQEKINKFSGYDLTAQLLLFKQKLIMNKIADEKTAEEVISIFANGGIISDNVSMDSTKKEPRLTFLKTEEDDSEATGETSQEED